MGPLLVLQLRSRPSCTVRRGITCLVAMLAAGGCGPQRYIAGRLVKDDALRRTYLSVLRHRTPLSAKLTQRLVVRAGRAEFDMLGYLFMDADGSWIALALGDMGVELFRFQCDSGRCELSAKPPSFPPKPLYDGVLGDLRHLYAIPTEGNSYLVGRGGHPPSLVSCDDAGYLDEYRLARDGSSVVDSCGVSNGRVVREVTYDSPTLFASWPYPLPAETVLHNHRRGYTMEVTLLDVGITQSP
ncbi:MAG: hypothetical protein ACE5HE_11055, partial [Phycisphaerae bacterium]